MTATLTVKALRRDVARLTKGQRIRVTFLDGVDAVGTLRGPSIISTPSQELTLDSPTCYRTIRHNDGTPGYGIATIDAWDDNARFDRLMQDAQDWAQLQEEAEHCPKSEKGWRQLKAEEAKQAFIDEWLRGEVR